MFTVSKYGEAVWNDRDPRSDEELELVRDDDVIRRAQLWATGATIHDVNSLIGLYRTATAVLDRLPGVRSVDEPGVRRWALELVACAFGQLSDFMRHGDYRKAKIENPLPNSKLLPNR